MYYSLPADSRLKEIAVISDEVEDYSCALKMEKSLSGCSGRSLTVRVIKEWGLSRRVPSRPKEENGTSWPGRIRVANFFTLWREAMASSRAPKQGGGMLWA